MFPPLVGELQEHDQLQLYLTRSVTTPLRLYVNRFFDWDYHRNIRTRSRLSHPNSRIGAMLENNLLIISKIVQVRQSSDEGGEVLE
jgi:hypothetical protein